MNTSRTSPRPGRRTQAGFTLTELVLVVLAMVVIAAIAMPRFGKVHGQTHDVQRIADLELLETALDQYRTDHGEYPRVEGWRGDAQNHGAFGYGPDGYVPGLVPEYLEMLPRDPDPDNPSGSKGYLYRSNGEDYKLIAHETPQNFPTGHRYFDPKRRTWAYQVSSEGGRDW